MKKSIFLAAAIISLVACSKEAASDIPAPSHEQGKAVELRVNAGGTRISSALGNDGETVEFKWQAEDSIKVSMGSNSSVFKLKSGAGTSSAVFEGFMPGEEPTFDVQYPYVTPDISVQEYSSLEAFSHDKVLFTATGCSTASPSFSLSAQNAFVRFNLWTHLSNLTIGGIVFKNLSTSAVDSLKINGGLTLPTSKDDAEPFFIVVPAGSYKFSAEVYKYSNSRTLCSFEPELAQTFVTGQILNMPAKKVRKTGITGTAKRTGDINVQWLQLWDDGPKWAAYNVGASSVYEYGGYYCWGGIVDQDPTGTCCSATTDIQGTSDDTAKNLWGNNWKMPDLDDFKALKANCTYVWKTDGAVPGMLITGKEEYSDNSVFIPASGYYDYSEGSTGDVGANGYCWSSTPDSHEGQTWHFFVESTPEYFYDNRDYGFPVRPILAE